MSITQATADTVSAVEIGTVGEAKGWGSLTLAFIPETSNFFLIL
jgi:hypothetical protein